NGIGEKQVSQYDLTGTKTDMNQAQFDLTGYGIEPKDQPKARERNLAMMALAAHGALGEGAMLAGVRHPTPHHQEEFKRTRSSLPGLNDQRVDIQPIRTIPDGTALKRQFMPIRPGGSAHTSTKTWGNKESAWQNRRKQMENDVHPELNQHYREIDNNFAR